MTLDDSSILFRLGSGEAIDVVCIENGMTRPKLSIGPDRRLDLN